MDRDEFLALYAAGQRNFSDMGLTHIRLYNAEHNSNIGRSVYMKRPDFSGMDLSNADLSGIILILVNLDRTNLSGTNLRGADLRGSALGETDLNGADLSGANLKTSYLYRADLRGANLKGADLESAILRGANLKNADLQDANLKTIVLEGARLEETNLQGTALESADLRSLSVRGCDLRGYNLRYAKLHGSNLRNLDLRGADLTSTALNAVALEGADLRGAILQNARGNGTIAIRADLGDANLSGATFIKGNFSEVNFKGADLSGANLVGTSCFRSDFSGANLSGSNLKLINLSLANLKGADLSGAILAMADLAGADLSGADLKGSDLSGANLCRANLSGADLAGANLSGTALDGANFTGAIGKDEISLPVSETKRSDNRNTERRKRRRPSVENVSETKLSDSSRKPTRVDIFTNSPDNPNLELLNRIKEVSAGLYYPSRSDRPYEVFLWETEHLGDFSLEGLLTVFDRSRQISMEEFLRGEPEIDKDDREVIDSFRVLLAELSPYLRDIEVIRARGVRPNLYLVLGRTPADDLLGLSTKVSHYLEHNYCSSFVFRFRDGAIAKPENRDLIVTLENSILGKRFSSDYLDKFVWKIAERREAVIQNLLDEVGIVTINEIGSTLEDGEGGNRLNGLIKGNLTDLRLYRYTIAARTIEMYFVGRVPNGDRVLIRTTSYES